jgi:hypothetical protein
MDNYVCSDKQTNTNNPDSLLDAGEVQGSFFIYTFVRFSHGLVPSMYRKVCSSYPF